MIIPPLLCSDSIFLTAEKPDRFIPRKWGLKWQKIWQIIR